MNKLRNILLNESVEVIAYHGTEKNVVGGFKPGTFFTEKYDEAFAYTQITDVDGDTRITYEPVEEWEAKNGKIPPPAPSEGMRYYETWPLYEDYVGPPNVIVTNGNTDRLFYWDGTVNAYGDKNIVILSGIMYNLHQKENGEWVDEFVYGPTIDDEGQTPREIERTVYKCRLRFENPITLPWHEANRFSTRLGDSSEEVERKISGLKAFGYDGVKTLSDAGVVFHGQEILNWIIFDPSQVTILKEKKVDFFGESLDPTEPYSDDTAWKMTLEEFLDFHLTGHIDSDAYKRMTGEGGLEWTKIENYPTHLMDKTLGTYTFSFRKHKDGDSVAAFLGDKPAGMASDEWGATGVWVLDKFQALGIGVELIQLVRKGTRLSTRPLGQATDAGVKLATSFYRRLVKEAIDRGEPVSQEVLDSLNGKGTRSTKNLASVKIDNVWYKIDHYSKGNRHELSLRSSDDENAAYAALLVFDVLPGNLSIVSFKSDFDNSSKLKGGLIEKAEELFLRKMQNGEIKNGEIVLYRGINKGNKRGRYYSTDKEWARQFTQTGRESEVLTIVMKKSDILRQDPLPYAGNEEAYDAAIQAGYDGGYGGVFFSEGDGEPESVFVLDPGKVKKLETVVHESVSKRILGLKLKVS